MFVLCVKGKKNVDQLNQLRTDGVCVFTLLNDCGKKNVIN